MSVQQMMGAPSEIINIMIGTIVFCTALPGMAPAIADFIARRRAEKEQASPAQGKEA